MYFIFYFILYHNLPNVFISSSVRNSALGNVSGEERIRLNHPLMATYIILLLQTYDSVLSPGKESLWE
jgi:hypothetical protein